MALELRQQLKLSQQLIMTPQLQMAIKLLQLSRQELLDMVNQELEENPTLEEDFSGGDSDEVLLEAQNMDKLPQELNPESEVRVEETIREDIDWSKYFEESSPGSKVAYESEAREAPSMDAFTTYRDSLNDHLLWQFLMTSPSEEEEEIGSQIIGNLNADGYLEITVEEVAELSDVTPEEVGQVLLTMQQFDPIGVCARNLSECLMIQAKHYELDNTIVVRIIEDHLNHVQNRNFKAICRALGADLESVTAAVNIITSLEPRPGREFSEEEVQYIEPDIYVYQYDNDFEIQLNDDGMPKLRINNFYKNAINSAETLPDTTRDYIQDKMRSAAWLIRSIHQREKTIYRVMESILKFQRAFFEKGVEHLKPMVLRDVAQDIDKHESTISRVTTNKYVYTPQGIFELKYFFNSSISRVYGEAIASASVQQKIKKIIESEDSARPLSDLKIADMLKAENIDIARRTVAKYRELMRILPSSKRKKI